VYSVEILIDESRDKLAER